MAATAVASGVPVSLWLTGEASWLAVPGRAEEFTLPHAAPLSELRDLLLESGRVTVARSAPPGASSPVADLLPGAEIRGAAAFVEEVLGRRRAGARLLTQPTRSRATT